MSKIINPQTFSITDFISQIFINNERNLIFWDTCALLDILRFPYRKGDLRVYRDLNSINIKIQNGEIYSVASSLTISEWNNHEEHIRNEINYSLTQTTLYHTTCLEITNEIFGSTYTSESLHDKNLVESFEMLSENILSKTIFIDTEEIANRALERVRDKLPPASKKNEFKDCTIWETILKLSRDINTINSTPAQIFYTVNTDDFIDKSREPRLFYGRLLSEASLSNLICCQTTAEVISRL